MPFPAVHPALDRALVNKGYAEPTPVQAAVLEEGAFGRDLLVSAQTGSGKTVAFGLALASVVAKKGVPTTLLVRSPDVASHINEHVADKAGDFSKKSSSQLLKNFLKEYMSSDKKHIVFVIDWVQPRQNTIHLFTPETRSVDTQSPPPRQC